MLLKCCTQYASKLGKLSSGHRTGKGQFHSNAKERQCQRMDYYSSIQKNAFDLVLMRWMNLEPTTQSEVSQKEKDKYRILMHIHGI